MTTASNQEINETENKENSDFFNIVFLAGLVSIFISSFIFMCYVSAFEIDASISFLLCALAFAGISFFSYHANDFLVPLHTFTGKQIVSVIAMAICVSLALFHIPAFPIFGGIALASSFFMWGEFCISFAHKTLVVIFSLLFAIAAFLSWTIDMNVSYTNLLILSTCLYVLSIALLFIIKRLSKTSKYLPVSKNECKDRTRFSQAGYAPAITDGLSTAFVLTALVSNTSNKEISLLLTISFSTAAFICLFQFLPKLRYERVLRIHASAFKFAAFALIYIFLLTGNIILGSFSLLICILYSSLLYCSLNERIRMLDLSPYWIFGSHGRYYFSSFIIGIICEFVSRQFVDLRPEILLILMFVVVWVLCVQEKGATFIEINNLNVEEKNSTKPDDEPQKGHWKKKIDSIAQAYNLTSRQKDVLVFLAQGRTAAYISEALFVSNATAKSHIYNIYQKLGIHSQQELLDIVEKIKR